MTQLSDPEDVSPFVPPKSNLLQSARRALILMGVAIAIIELLEHLITNRLSFEPEVTIELLIYLTAMPLMGWVLSIYLKRSEEERLRQTRVIVEQNRLSRNLSSATEWSDLVRQTVEFAHLIIPVERVRFFLRNPNNNDWQIAGCWSTITGYLSAPDSNIKPFACTICNETGSGYIHRAEPPVGVELPPDHRVFCLPLHLGQQVIGLLQFETDPDYTPTASQVEALNNGAVVIEMAVERANLRNTAITQSLANQEERKRIAQDLHDTLGPNIAYLRLKLDGMLLEDDPANQIVRITDDLTKMRDIADLAYQQVRETLAELREPQPKNLAQEVFARANLVASRAGFHVIFEEIGEPCCLEPYFSRQVLYTLREAFNNIEKYAHASEAHLTFHWLPEQLEIRLEDNGQGFDPASVDTSSHYGLQIMRERVESISGSLTIVGIPGSGTIITIHLPLNKL